jgi:hypothetical protein
MPIIREYCKRILIILIAVGILLPNFAFLETQPVQIPENLEEAKEVGRGFLKELPNQLEKIWRKEVFPLWQKIYNWLKEKIWDSYLWPKIGLPLKKEIEKRKPIIKEEFKKEKKEMKEEIKTKLPTGKSLWERFKELIK